MSLCILFKISFEGFTNSDSSNEGNAGVLYHSSYARSASGICNCQECPVTTIQRAPKEFGPAQEAPSAGLRVTTLRGRQEWAELL
eukprot:5975905-Amphidinium_carterae.3